MKDYILNISFLIHKPIKYYLEFKNNFIFLNSLINKTLKINFIHNKCIICKIYNSIYKKGYCKNCFFKSLNNYIGIIKPELCRAHLNIAYKDIDFEKSIELQKHIVYLSITSNIKVGITKKKA